MQGFYALHCTCVVPFYKIILMCFTSKSFDFFILLCASNNASMGLLYCQENIK